MSYVRFYGKCKEWVEVTDEDQQGVRILCGRCHIVHDFMKKVKP